MTSTVPAVYAFPEFSGVAAAVADHVVAAQNAALAPPKKISSNTTSTNSTVTTPTVSNSNSTTNTSSTSSQLSPSTSNTLHSSQHISIGSTNIPGSQQQPHPVNAPSQRRFKIGLSGGSLISVLQEGLLARPDIIWDRWDIYFADERLVPFDSPESNYGLVKRKLLDALPEGTTPPNVYHVDEALLDDAQEAADAYEKVLIKGFANKDSVKLPMFDLLLLGCAPDGHICSLFPGHPLLREEYAWVAPIEDAPKPPPRRITLTLPVIYHAHRVTFVVEGSTKAPVLKTIMERPEKGLPSSLVNEAAAGKVSWFVDDEALSGVFVTKKEYKIQVPLNS